MYEAPPDISFAFIIDTESYAGNFEREMCAYCTGEIGECGVGDNMASLFQKEMELGDEDEGPFAKKILQRADEYGCGRPVSIWPTKGWFNNGMGGHFRDGQEPEALEHRNQEYRNYGDKKPYSTNEEANEKHRRDWYEKQPQPLGKFPAYNSVAIFFSERPTDEEVRLIIERAKKFATERPDGTEDWQDRTPIKITGFRLIQETVQQETMKTWNV